MTAPGGATAPLVTIAVPSLNQGRFLDAALGSIFAQPLAVEVFVIAGSIYLLINFILTRAALALEWWLSPHLRGAPLPAPRLEQIH